MSSAAEVPDSSSTTLPGAAEGSSALTGGARQRPVRSNAGRAKYKDDLEGEFDDDEELADAGDEDDDDEHDRLRWTADEVRVGARTNGPIPFHAAGRAPPSRR
jgi:hypothetical protein